MSRAQRRALVEREDPALPVLQQCRLLAVSRASVYRRLAEVSDEDRAIMALIDRRYLARPYYGSRRMAAWLATQGPPINRKRVQRLMRLIGLVAVYQRPNTSKPAAAHKVYPYLLGGLSIDRVNQVWCSDITYIPMAKGFLYLVAIMDWHSRAVLAWRLSNTLGADFCVEALEDALARYGKPEVFNTDQGCQFTGTEFTSVLEHCGITISMDGKGRCMDNIFIERLWRSLKYEEVYLHAYASVAEATAGIGNWFRFYNEERQHQSLGYRTPQQTYAAECPWICGRSASPTGCASPASRASSKSGEVLAFAHIPTRTTVNRRIDQKDFDGRVTSASTAMGADIEIGRATP
jgi:putative transposase